LDDEEIIIVTDDDPEPPGSTLVATPPLRGLGDGKFLRAHITDAAGDGEQSGTTLSTRGGIAYYMIGGKMFPLIIEPKCRVCKLPLSMRTEIDTAIVRGALPKKVSDLIREAAKIEVSDQSVYRHRTRHLPKEMLQDQMTISAFHDVFAALGDKIGQATMDRLIVRDLVTQHVMEAIATGEIKPSMNDFFAFHKLDLRETEIMAQQKKVEMFFSFATAIVKLMMERLTRAQYQPLFDAMYELPEWRQIIEAAQPDTEMEDDDEVADAELVG
jgi:hypothetical protein